MGFDILDKSGDKVSPGSLLRIKASASDVFQFSIKHDQGHAAAGTAVTITVDDMLVALGWNEAKLDTLGKKANVLGPSQGLCGDGEMVIKVGHSTQTVKFRFVKTGD
jgi:hypothetical protein